MKIVAQIIAYPIIGVLYTLVALLSLLYFIDFMHELITDFRCTLMLIVMLLGSGFVLVLYYAAIATYFPLVMATEEDSPTGRRLAGLALTPLGLLAGFLLWQVQNWLFFGVLDIDPWSYNCVFRYFGLAI